MYLRRAIALALALLATSVTASALAWQEAHETGDDVELHVEPDGAAAVRHHLRWRVVHGPLRSIDLANVEVGAAIDPAVKVVAEDGRELSAHVVRAQGQDERSVRIEPDDPRAFMRGAFTFELNYRVDWVAARAITADGPAWRLTWSGPVAADGFDSARVTLDLPAAPDEPRAILADTGAPDDSAIFTLRREAARDVLDLVRPHVARGESVSWTVRLDPRALPAVVDPRLRPAARARPPEEPSRARAVSLAGGLAALALAFALLVGHKARAFAAACADRGARARGLLPLPAGVRAGLAGASLAAGVALQALGRFDRPTAGAVFVALATLAAAVRAAPDRRAPRGPGRWLVLRPDDVFALAPGRGHWLDLDAPAGRVTAALAAGASVAAVLAARALDPRLAWVVAIDALAFVPLLATGRAASLPPRGVRGEAPWLSTVFGRLRQDESLRVAPWVRAVPGGSTGDELRLLVLPRAATPGLVGIEAGIAWSATPAGWAESPEVLVRVLERSPAAARLTLAAPSSRATLGRRADERVVVLCPRAPTRAGTVALVREVARALADRRGPSAPERTGQPERRAPAPQRRADPAARGRRPAPDRAASQATPSC